MTFYENQHQARRKTAVLFGYFVAAVILIVVAVNAVIYLTLFFSDAAGVISLTQWIKSPICWVIAAATLALIIGGSLARYIKLKDGGDAIAAMMGGRLVQPSTNNFLERRLLNVTEEMAIASGTHIPRVYLLEEEQGINAFVAGFTPNKTILAVTQGALNNLTRDELQGVIGHEFSHILNNDTRINLNLISILAGILLIGKIGESLLRGSRYSRRDKNRGGQGVLGLALMAIGYIGLFFGRLIKAAISRQREFLADASSVQFTRNPYGIGGALYKIGQLQQGSHLVSNNAEDMSHMCFGETLRVNFSSLLATHPPIEDRLRSIDPSLPARMKSRLKKGTLTFADGVTPFTPEGGPSHITAETISQFSGSKAEPAPPVSDEKFSVNKQQIKASVGNLTPEHIDEAHKLHQSIPQDLLNKAHQSQEADCIIYALILTTMSSHGKEAMQLINSKAGQNKAETTREIYQLLRKHPEAIRLPLLEIAINTLEALNSADKLYILNLSQVLINVDEKYTLYEFIYVSLIEKYLAPPKKGKKATIKSYQKVENAIAVLIAAVVLVCRDKEGQAIIFAQIMPTFSNKDFSHLLKNPPGVKTLEDALKVLNRLSPLLKQPLIDACVDCIVHDSKVTHHETSLLRAICERLECPMPLITAQTSGALKG